jgi:hypothetical protein
MTHFGSAYGPRKTKRLLSGRTTKFTNVVPGVRLAVCEQLKKKEWVQ